MSSKSFAFRGPLLILLGSLCFCTTGFTQAVAPDGATPYVVGCVRMLIGGIALMLWCLFCGRLPRRGDWPPAGFVACVLAVLGFQVTFFSAVKVVGVAVGTVIAIGTTPIAAALLGWMAYGERPSLAWYPATILAVGGLALLNDIGNADADIAGMLLPVAAGVSYAVFITFGRALTRSHAPDTVMAVVELSVGALMSPVLFLFPTDWIFTPEGALVSIHLGVVTAAMAFSLSLAGFRMTSAATGSTLSLAEPLGAACLGVFALHEPVTSASVVGIALMLGGVLLLVFFPGVSRGDGWER